MTDSPHNFEPLVRLGDEFARATRAQAQAHHTGRSLRDRLGRVRAAVAALVIAVVVAAVAVAPVRGALGDLGDTIAGIFDPDDPPGRAIEASDSPPDWLVAEGQTGQRVLASSGPYSLYLVREAGGNYGFALDESVGISDTRAGWERQFADNAIVILGPGTRPDDEGRVPLYGLTAGNVATVELRYEDESSTSAPADTGGFVLMLDQRHSPVELVALDGAGRVLQTLDAHRFAR